MVSSAIVCFSARAAKAFELLRTAHADTRDAVRTSGRLPPWHHQVTQSKAMDRPNLTFGRLSASPDGLKVGIHGETGERAVVRRTVGVGNGVDIPYHAANVNRREEGLVITDAAQAARWCVSKDYTKRKEGLYHKMRRAVALAAGEVCRALSGGIGLTVYIPLAMHALDAADLHRTVRQECA